MAEAAQMQVSDEVAVQIENMNKWYGTFHVLRDIDLTVYRGERIVIAGPSGSGKSTLIRCINALEEHQKGRITVDGTVLSSDLKNIDKIRSEVGMVFQHFNLFPHRTALGNIVEAPVQVKGVKKARALERARDLLDQVGLADKAEAYPAQLSGGQQQRLVIARAIAIQPEVILLDEPCSALDPISTLKVEELINELKRDYTIVIVTHNMQQAARVSDYTAFMYVGNLVEYGNTDQVFTKPQQKQTEDYITGRYG